MSYQDEDVNWDPEKDWVVGCSGCVIKSALLFITLIVVLFVSMYISDKQKERYHKEIIIRNSAIYIYNHYEDVRSLEYRDFTVNTFGLGTDSYNVSITVNGTHDFELARIWDMDIEDENTEVVAYERRRHSTLPEKLLPEKSEPTNLKVLPDDVDFRNYTK